MIQNFDLVEDAGLPLAVVRPGLYVAHAPEQTDKTVGITAMCAYAHTIRRPSIVIVMDKRANAEGVARKAGEILAEFPLLRRSNPVFLWGSRGPWEREGVDTLDAVRNGRRPIVVPG
ncbi:hypothetical protein KFL_000240110 [Klebsormidium nitens]|uniref:Uncharacterized protein n=1 Tax=Klebsormidium nitens TaxID=105231 RepID=A0A1Y1HQ21_KLENI|nr:hypothetical protein KFL_000240110 [Klebsormidium nitens]|eukprot:GAQ79081.1 hypothetical protein KFL_000240110 [Klebsormidium nitens]